MVVADVEDYRQGGSGPPDSGKFLLVSVSSNPTVCHGVLGDVPSDWEDPGKVTPQGGPLYGKIQPKMTGLGRWIYLSLDEAMEAVGLEEVETYTLCLQNTVS